MKPGDYLAQVETVVLPPVPSVNAGACKDSDKGENIGSTLVLGFGILTRGKASSLGALCCLPPIIHCDLKSSNLHVDQNLKVKIGDFGLCRIKQESHVTIKDGTGMAPLNYKLSYLWLNDYIKRNSNSKLQARRKWNDTKKRTTNKAKRQNRTWNRKDVKDKATRSRKVNPVQKSKKVKVQVSPEAKVKKYEFRD
ncbi:PAS domain-containing protein tyrosine kinase family protein [Tanacetum coccineum]